MSAYISTELNMVRANDPKRYELSLDIEAFLGKGGTIEVLRGPSFVPPPIRHEPAPREKAAKPKPAAQAATSGWIDKMSQRDIEREERVAQRAKEKAERIEYVRKLAETMTYSQAILRTGLPLRTLQQIALNGGFKFQPAIKKGSKNQPKGIDEDRDAKYAERIRAFLEIGLSRNQAMGQLCMTFATFNRLLDKFAIDYPKRSKGPHPAFFAKTVKS